MTSHTDHQLQLILANCWQRIAGEDVAAVTLITAVTDGVLTVLVPSPAWVDQLTPRTAELCERINHALLSPCAITGITFCEGIAK